MTEITVRFNLTFSRRFVSTFTAAAMMLCAVPELNSESVTLSTYYPAPSGVYTNMITTGNTYLARDGAGTRVGIGTISPSYKLDVNGDIGVGAGSKYTTAAGNDLNLDAPAGRSLYLKVGGATMVTTGATGNVGIGMTSSNKLSVSGAIESTSVLQTRQGAACTGPFSYNYPTPLGGTLTICGGQYVTTVAGVLSKYILLPLDRGPSLVPPINPTFTYLCCPCPTGGCAGM